MPESFVSRFFKCVECFKNNRKYNAKSWRILDRIRGLYFEKFKKNRKKRDRLVVQLVVILARIKREKKTLKQAQENAGEKF